MLTGSTTRIIVNFNDWVTTLTSNLPIDPDSNIINIYDSKLNLLITGTLTRDDVGLYHYDYQLPATAGVYTVEVIGVIAGLNNVARTNITLTFD